MSNKQLRNLIRFFHLASGVLIVALVYSDTLRASTGFMAAMQFGVIPLVVLSGVAMWQQPVLSRMRRQLSGTA